MALSGMDIVPNDKIQGWTKELRTENKLISFSCGTGSHLGARADTKAQEYRAAAWEQKGRGVFPLPVQNVEI